MGTKPRSPRAGLEKAIVSTQAVLGAGLLLAYVLRPLPLASLRSPWLSVAAAFLATTGAAVGLLALARARPFFRVGPIPRSDSTLVRSGIYGHLRHPMYTSVVSLVAAMSLHHPGVLTWVLALLNVSLYQAKARYEEGLLAARYPEYDAYRRRTWGVVPGLGRRGG